MNDLLDLNASLTGPAYDRTGLKGDGDMDPIGPKQPADVQTVSKPLQLYTKEYFTEVKGKYYVVKEDLVSGEELQDDADHTTEGESISFNTE